MDRLLIRGGLLHDGSGQSGRKADLLVNGATIAAIGHLAEVTDADIIDASGCVVAPGFIDAHRHCDIAAIDDPGFGQLELAQGITTVVGGNCGLSIVPLGVDSAEQMLDYLAPITGRYALGPPAYGFREYFERLSQARPPLHVGLLAGSCSIKASLLGYGGRHYDEGSLAQARAQVREALAAGALGLSLGLMYEPERGSTVEQIIEVASAARAADGLLCVHMRTEGDGLLSAIDEAILIAEKAGIRLNISHLKATGARNWGWLVEEAIGRIEKARARGLEVSADVYPYAAGATTLLSILPPQLAALPKDELMILLDSRPGLDRLRAAYAAPWTGADNLPLSIGWNRILLSSVTRAENARFAGQSLARVGELLGVDPAEALARLLVTEQGRCGVIVMSMSPADVETVVRQPWVSFISDALYGGGDRPHPRLHDSFPRFIRDFVLDKPVLTMEEAIRKASALPAEKLGLTRQGQLSPGKLADIVVFRPAAMTEGATFEQPRRAPKGVEYTIVEGRVAFAQGQVRKYETGASPARRG